MVNSQFTGSHKSIPLAIHTEGDEAISCLPISVSTNILLNFSTVVVAVKSHTEVFSFAVSAVTVIVASVPIIAFISSIFISISSVVVAVDGLAVDSFAAGKRETVSADLEGPACHQSAGAAKENDSLKQLHYEV
jgi:hypothetical protein